jgi:hypothetical protein
MNRDEKHIARVLFQLKLHQSDGQAYEDIFTKVMQMSNPHFRPIKPQGRIGDKKNDGYDKQNGIYYQCYAPENLARSVSYAVSKLKEDFNGLMQNWNEAGEVKQFYYVLNDKYKGTYPEIELELDGLQKSTGIICNPFLCKDLEDVFMQLSEQDILNVISFLPSSENIKDLDYSVLNQVITHLLKYEVEFSIETKPDNPDFERKITFNNLSTIPSNLLRTGSYQEHAISEYFGLSSSFAKEDLRQVYSELYKEASSKFEGEENKSDRIFFEILDKSSPQKVKPIRDAVFVLMAYYFTYCDIFEVPN